MSNFFKQNIGRHGRMARGIAGGVLLIAGIIMADFQLAVSLPLVAVGLFCIFEAIRGWCLLRACGLRTRH